MPIFFFLLQFAFSLYSLDSVFKGIGKRNETLPFKGGEESYRGSLAFFYMRLLFKYLFLYNLMKSLRKTDLCPQIPQVRNAL